ncbi:predicted protein [Aspergillus terreus NIH2624]|uniref:N-acetyltransferase domain-containing protein n=1 Tax=Aspergillus terreus (strain NIH 2624 / FGSC A1156) TaxID=341663 RepID=Q0CG85_ASPTN|nr:uncharacterized protein ATEG_07307 [Aspergillus terreus NIH2624]EAU32691.1 predicted protein [Aspergillus terreus NIH2624]
MLRDGVVVSISKSYPSPTDQASIIERYKTLRLTGLKQDPQSFSSTYDQELQFPLEKWLARMANPEARTLVALKAGVNETPSTPQDDIAALLSRDWVGTLTTMGPKSLQADDFRSTAPWTLFTNPHSHAPSRGGSKTGCVYMLAGMFVVQEERRNGHGRRLVEKAVQNAYNEAEQAHADRLFVVALVNPENQSACALYAACGFEIWDGEVAMEGGGAIETCVAMVLEKGLTKGVS